MQLELLSQSTVLWAKEPKLSSARESGTVWETAGSQQTLKNTAEIQGLAEKYKELQGKAREKVKGFFSLSSPLPRMKGNLILRQFREKSYAQGGLGQQSLSLVDLFTSKAPACSPGTPDLWYPFSNKQNNAQPKVKAAPGYRL